MNKPSETLPFAEDIEDSFGPTAGTHSHSIEVTAQIEKHKESGLVDFSLPFSVAALSTAVKEQKE